MRIIYLMGVLLTSGLAFSQPVGSPPSNTTNAQAAAAWYRGGNNPTSPNNIFGTRWNSGIYTMTDNQFRMQLNGTVSYPVNGFNGIRNGYMLIGQQMSNNYGAGNGAYSLLHLNGNNFAVSIMPSLGYRPWMQTGVTFTDNGDLAYLGLRRIGPTIDLTEVTMSWSNDLADANGPDDMVFRFLNGNGGTLDTNLTSNSDLDGRHVARFTDQGLMGLGNTFGVNGINNQTGRYVRPQSLLHMSYSNLRSVWSQYTNRHETKPSEGKGGTGEAITDGLRIGILGSPNSNINGTAAIYNQEKKPLLLSSDANTTTITPISGKTNERVRVTSVSTPTNLPTGGMGIYNPGTFTPNTSDTNKTRVSISHDPSRPVTRPLSLLHIGYNTGLNSSNPSSTDGWRKWMDIGAFINDGTDNMYIGLKKEGTDRSDAVVNWGDNQNGGLNGTLGPDNLRFIFTSTTTGFPSGDANSISGNGLEIARITPIKASTLPASNYGMMGIGDFSPTSANNGSSGGVINYVDAKLDIDGDLRIRSVTPETTLTQVLVIDPLDKNRVHYRDIGTFGIGNYCSDPQNNLTGDYEIPLTGNYNYYFSGANTSSVGIGWTCGSSLKAKIDVIDDTKGIAGQFNTYGTGYGTGYGVKANAYSPGVGNIGVEGYATGSGSFNYGILGYANGATIDRAGYFNGLVEASNISIVSDQQFKTNVTSIPSALDIVKQLSPRNYYMDTSNFNQFNFESRKQFGFIAQEIETVIPEVVYDSYNPGIRDSTGAFVGQPLSYKSVNYNAIIPINTQAIKELNLKVEKQTLSDQSIKSNVQDLTGSLNKVLAMRGVSFNWNQNLQPQFQLDNSNHVGFIAQEINAVDPRLTFMGDENLMHVDYDKIVPITVEAIQELNSQIAQRDSVINSLNDRLSHLESCLSGILPFLCQISHNSIQPTQQEFQQQLKKEIDVQLSNKGTIILNQNVPNPFAEQTQISFSIPETVKKAQIHFYDANGKLINSVEVQERGLGQLNVFANDLSTGMYTYTLVADGQIVATKKMMKQ